MTKPAVDKIKDELGIGKDEAQVIINKSKAGGEFDDENIDSWIEKRLLPNIVTINKDTYARMCVSALKIVGGVAPTDYGSSRQRDLGQLWADMIRGYLGEAALLEFLNINWGIKSDLGHEKGSIKEYLPMDIHEVTFPGEIPRSPKLNVSVKATKWNGIWLDIPGGQFEHSDIHIFVKVGVGRDHLFAFFKEISVFKDKILKVGEELGSLSRDESEKLFDSLPEFKPVPAYICGFVKKSSKYAQLPYGGKKGRKHFKVKTWNGQICPGDLEKIKKIENITGKVEFEGIGKFSHDNGYLFNAGSLLWKKEDWEWLIENL